MFAVLIPLLIVGTAIAALRGNRASRDRVSALQTFCAFLRDGLPPPVFVCELARQEALSIGDAELAAKIAIMIAQHASVSGPAPAVFTPSPQAPAASYEQTNRLYGTPSAEPTVGLASPPMAFQPVSSPIASIGNESWDALCKTLAIDHPDHDSDRRVGKYSARKSRLEQIGIDPATIVGSSDAQDDALCADLADAHHRLEKKGVLHKVVGKLVRVPDMETPVSISLSGLLGLTAVAGVDGATKWLTHEDERKRFPHNTNIFLRSNGIF
jgi:hypothetical protein